MSTNPLVAALGKRRQQVINQTIQMYIKNKQKPRRLTYRVIKLFLMIKLSAVFILLTMMQVNANVKAQLISLSEKKATLVSVFDKISTQTGYDFLINDALLKAAKPVSIVVGKVDMKFVLDRIFSNQELSYSIRNKTIMVSKKEAGLVNKIKDAFFDRTLIFPVKGQVTDEVGKPLPGAKVQLQGAKIATSTNAEGYFYLELAENSGAIEISYIGFESTTLPVSRDMGLIKLQPSMAKLNEVEVTTGYQSILKERAPGSYAQVSSETLSKRPVSNLSTALQGLVAGMQSKENADGSVQLLIRGNSSLYADRRPLIVVDGFPVTETDFSSINPNDVASVTVLKDGAAASIWGARSGNGVIVVMTKKGSRKQGLHIEASAFTRISKQTDLNQLLNQGTSAEQIAYERLAYKNGWFFNQYAGSFRDIIKPLTLGQELLFANTNGKITTTQMNKGLDSLAGINNQGQIQDLLLRRAMLDQYNVSFAGGSEKSSTYASLLFENNKTRYEGSGYKRYGINLNNDYQITKFMTFRFGLNLQYRSIENSGATPVELQQLSPYETLLNPDGSYAVNLNNLNREQLSVLPLSQFPYQDWNYNLLRDVRSRKLTGEDISARIQTGLNFKILPGLTFDTQFQYEQRKLSNKNYYSEDNYFVRDLANTMVEYNNTTQVVGRSFVPKGGIENSNNSEWKSYVFRNQFSYVIDFNDKHSINAIAGTELSQSRMDNRINPWQYGYFPEKLQSTVPIYGYGGPSNLFRNFMGTATTLDGGNTSLSYNLNRFVSFYANAAYTYDQKYTLSGSVRSDASNFITDDPALRWSPLWSVGALWNIRKEGFMDGASFVDQLNLRVTHGRNGNVEATSSTKAVISVSPNPSSTTGTVIATISDYGNPTLRWEKTQTTNLGVDFSFFKQKLVGKVDLYNKLGKDITALVALASANGTTSQRFNNAGIVNRGIEIELGTQVNIPGTAIGYTTAFNYAYNKNYVNDLKSPVTTTPGYLNAESAFVQGRPINPIYTFTYAGMIDGVPQISGPNGTPASFNSNAVLTNAKALEFLNYEGTATPPHTLGWSNAFRYKNFSINTLFVGKLGGVYRNEAFNYASTLGSIKFNVNGYITDVFDGRTDIPGFPKPNEGQLYLWDRYVPYLNSLVESSSYIEFKELMLDYSLPSRIASKIGGKALRFFVQARDLGLIWSANKQHYNPDWLPGTDRPLSTYTLGLTLKF